MVELWDAYDREGNKLGFDLVRDDPFPDHVYHLVCDVVVQHVDGSFLLMQRALDKKGWPGMFEVGAGGSALKGETPIQGALRELKEETGIAGKDLKQIYHFVKDEFHTIYYGYLCITDCSKDSVTLQEGETIDYKWISKEELVAHMDSDVCIDSQKVRLKDFVDSLQ